MSRPMITYNPKNGEVRSIPEAFAEKNDYVASIVWEKKVGEKISKGEKLCIVQWGQSGKEPLTAPDNCEGKINSLNRSIMFEELGIGTSQLFATIV